MRKHKAKDVIPSEVDASAWATTESTGLTQSRQHCHPERSERRRSRSIPAINPTLAPAITLWFQSKMTLDPPPSPTTLSSWAQWTEAQRAEAQSKDPCN